MANSMSLNRKIGIATRNTALPKTSKAGSSSKAPVVIKSK